MPLRLIFMGTPDFAVPTLRALADRGHKIVAVYTREAKPAGRGMKTLLTPVAQEAIQREIPVLTPTTLKAPEALNEFRAHNAEAAVVVAYGMILPESILEAPEHGCFNLHASLLPHWRGAAPINRAIMAGDPKSGVMVMKMATGLDTGDVVKIKAKSVVYIKSDTTAGDLHDELAMLGANLMALAMDRLDLKGKLQLEEQDHKVEVSYAHKIEKAEARIRWGQSRAVVRRHINGLSPFPGAWCELKIEDELVRFKILRCSFVPGPRRTLLPEPGTLLDDGLAVACEDGAIRILELQRAGRPPMKAAEFLRGTPLKPPIRLV